MYVFAQIIDEPVGPCNGNSGIVTTITRQGRAYFVRNVSSHPGVSRGMASNCKGPQLSQLCETILLDPCCVVRLVTHGLRWERAAHDVVRPTNPGETAHLEENERGERGKDAP